MKTTITRTNTKQEIADFLIEVASTDKYAIEDKSMVEMVTYTVKKYLEDKTQVLKADLLEVALELQDFLSGKSVLKPVENKLKVVTATDEKVDKPKKEEVKTVKAKKTAKDVSQVLEVVTLPKSITTEFGDMTLVTDGIKTIKDFKKAVEDGRDLYLAVYWTEKLLKQFSYTGDPLFDKVKSFPLDLDIRKPIYFPTSVEVVYALSLYTESLGMFKTDAFELVEGIRYSNTAEWGVYEIVEEEEEKPKPVKKAKPVEKKVKKEEPVVEQVKLEEPKLTKKELEAMNEVDEESVKELEQEALEEDKKKEEKKKPVEKKSKKKTLMDLKK